MWHLFFTKLVGINRYENLLSILYCPDHVQLFYNAYFQIYGQKFVDIHNIIKLINY